MEKIGYIRVSSTEQNIHRQVEQLSHCQKVFIDKLSGQNKNRPELEKMLAYIREGDLVVVTELDRLGRNNEDLTEIMDHIKKRGATLEVLNLPQLNGIQDENLRLLLNNLIMELYKYQAESERKRIIERQQQGIRLAKEAGKYKGRKPKYTEHSENLQHAFDLLSKGASEAEAARKAGINRSTFRRYREKYL
ncbi:recombinase family protein [Listeria fleischmannii]|uniref:recombinase family protein n=1 Tax=Listeria fleischmannii TaxID=1069827 RepID=UPI001628A5FB|nr:recombinase family protein [Listeria fleischmannii]MBC1419911.1 recombinase family protein [Listeria fleischmannii]